MFFASLTDANLNVPLLAATSQITVDPADTLAPLQLGGWMREPGFGGDGPEMLGVLEPFQVYATLVPEDTLRLAIGGDTLVTASGMIDDGQVIFLGGEPSPQTPARVFRPVPRERSVTYTETVAPELVAIEPQAGSNGTVNLEFTSGTIEDPTIQFTASSDEPAIVVSVVDTTGVLSWQLAAGQTFSGTTRITVVAENAGGRSDTIHFGLTAGDVSAIYGTKFLDENMDGTRDQDEPGLDGIQLFLDRNENGQWDADEPATFSDANGQYLLTAHFDLGTNPGAPDPVRIVEIPPPGTLPSGELFRTVSFAQLEEIATEVDFGNVPTPIVTTLADEDDGDWGEMSLREALNLAEFRPGKDTVLFAPELAGGTITLDPARGQLQVTSDLDLVGLGATALTIDAGGSGRVFEIGSGVTASIRGVTISGGGGVQFGGGILSKGTLTLEARRLPTISPAITAAEFMSIPVAKSPYSTQQSPTIRRTVTAAGSTATVCFPLSTRPSSATRPMSTRAERFYVATEVESTTMPS